ncbi:MAG TPA: EthD domain-containing protein [Acidimicrobiia bacterium]|nr:EthD domain-containing protein [Acidimicrobiia bacterium]
MAERREQTLVALAWPDGAPQPEPLAGWSAAGWRVEPVLADQSALDRAGSKGRTPPPFQTLLWHDLAPGDPAAVLVADGLPDLAARWTALRVVDHPAWDDTTERGVVPQVKQVSFLKAQTGLTQEAFRRHFREHVAVARVHHPAICRYEQHDVLDRGGDAGLDTQGVSELWFADEDDLAARYFAGPDSVPIVRADNREYIDFSGTLSLLVRPDDRRGPA